jgi:hypothetical protein
MKRVNEGILHLVMRLPHHSILYGKVADISMKNRILPIPAEFFVNDGKSPVCLNGFLVIS